MRMGSQSLSYVFISVLSIFFASFPPILVIYSSHPPPSPSFLSTPFIVPPLHSLSLHLFLHCPFTQQLRKTLVSAVLFLWLVRIHSSKEAGREEGKGGRKGSEEGTEKKREWMRGKDRERWWKWGGRQGEIDRGNEGEEFGKKRWEKRIDWNEGEQTNRQRNRQTFRKRHRDGGDL